MSATVYHQELVERLKKSGDVIESEMTGYKCDLMHMAVGVSGEAGELLDVVKKFVIYNKPLDKWHAVEELGDLEFFLEGVRQALHVTREEVLQHNINKLERRYHKGKYSDEQAQQRADKT